MQTVTITTEHIELIRVLNWTLSDNAPKVNQNQPFTSYSDAYEAITKYFGNVTPMQVDEIMQEINIAVMIMAQRSVLTVGTYELTKTGWRKQINFEQFA
jgi:hypothetical protein